VTKDRDQLVRRDGNFGMRTNPLHCRVTSVGGQKVLDYEIRVRAWRDCMTADAFPIPPRDIRAGFIDGLPILLVRC
jgi:hypothetical protein